MKFSSFILVVFLSLVGDAFAQAPGEPPIVNVSLTAMRFGPPIDPVFFASLDGEATELTMPIEVPSRPENYEGPTPMVLFRETTNEKGEIVRVPVSSVRLPTDAKRLLLICFTRPDGSEELSVHPIPNSPEDFPPGQYRFWNLTNLPMAVMLDKERVMVEPGRFASASPSVDEAEGFGVKIAYWDSTASSWKPALSSGWTHRDQRQVLAFFFPTESGKPEVVIHATRPY